MKSTPATFEIHDPVATDILAPEQLPRHVIEFPPPSSNDPVSNPAKATIVHHTSIWVISPVSFAGLAASITVQFGFASVALFIHADPWSRAILPPSSNQR